MNKETSPATLLTRIDIIRQALKELINKTDMSKIQSAPSLNLADLQALSMIVSDALAGKDIFQEYPDFFAQMEKQYALIIYLDETLEMLVDLMIPDTGDRSAEPEEPFTRGLPQFRSPQYYLKPVGDWHIVWQLQPAQIQAGFTELFQLDSGLEQVVRVINSRFYSYPYLGVFTAALERCGTTVNLLVSILGDFDPGQISVAITWGVRFTQMDWDGRVPLKFPLSELASLSEWQARRISSPLLIRIEIRPFDQTYMHPIS